MAWRIGALHFDYSLDPAGLFGLYFALHFDCNLKGLHDYHDNYS